MVYKSEFRPDCVNTLHLVSDLAVFDKQVVVQVGQEFVDAADLYVRKFLNNGVPSLFSDLKPLYR